MRSERSVIFLLERQQTWYYELQCLAQSNPVLARFVAVPIVVGDVALEIVKPVFATVELLALSAINCFGALYSKWFSVRDSLVCFNFALCNLASIPVYLALAPVHLVIELYEGMVRPQVAYHKWVKIQEETRTTHLKQVSAIIRDYSVFLHSDMQFHDRMFVWLNNCAITNPNLGYLCAPAIACIDILLQSVLYPVAATAHTVFLAFKEIIFCPFEKERSLLRGISFFHRACCHLTTIIPGIVMFPINLFYQAISTCRDPRNAKSLHSVEGYVGVSRNKRVILIAPMPAWPLVAKKFSIFPNGTSRDGQYRILHLVKEAFDTYTEMYLTRTEEKLYGLPPK